ncbi:MAG: hypothetical protein K6B70_02105 [Clostridia bacterium]|nr:hypothetical protein [Clostridia bacterium]
MNEKRKKIMGIALVIVYLVLTVSGLVLMKKGGNSGTLSFNEGNLGFNINWISALGFICYICSFLLFTRIVIMFDLSYIMPLVTGIVQILTLICAFAIFKEPITKQGIIGASIIIIGIIVMNFKKV